jgi:hypothetical protein
MGVDPLSGERLTPAQRIAGTVLGLGQTVMSVLGVRAMVSPRLAPRPAPIGTPNAGRLGVFAADVPPPEGFWRLRDIRREFQELTRGATYDEVVAGARRLGWEGDIVVFRGGSGISAAVLPDGPNGTLIVFERGVVHGQASRPIRGNALLAHEIGHGSTTLPNSANLARNQPRFWLREMQANAQALRLPGLTFAERLMLIDDFIYSMRQFREYGGVFPGEVP